MNNIAKVLMDNLRHEAKQARVVLETAGGVELDFVPSEGMRTLRELANHLAQIPKNDPMVYSAEIKDDEGIQEMEKKLWRDELAEMTKVLDEGMDEAEARFVGMSDADFLDKKLKPFYEEGPAKNWAYYLPEMIAHIVMHKMQLWMYLKLAGANVDMHTYYGKYRE
ncbi:MAG: hypothetical protein ACFFD9_07605 [Candidatus Thorarchaeota archaeon]